jgi:hypothetical protein
MDSMISASSTESSQQPSPIPTTLLNLVWAVSQVTDDERVVVVTVAHLINNGQAQLTGTFKGTRAIRI